MVRKVDLNLILCPKCLGDEIAFNNDGEKPKGWFCFTCKNRFQLVKRIKQSELLLLLDAKRKLSSVKRRI